MAFDRFMEMALYCPEHGYYERLPHKIGRRGDFFTSVSVGALFGQLLAFQFCQWLAEIGTAHGRLQMVEAAAHDGQLARDILDWLKAHASELLAIIDYVILEPSARRESWQRETLGDCASHVRWCRGWGDAALGGLRGVVFSNELLDSFPVRRFGWSVDTHRWFEYGVTTDGSELQWCRLPISEPDQDSLAAEVPRQVLDLLPDGFVVERAPATLDWWQQAARALDRGWLLTIDYGFETGWPINPSQPLGTLRAYRRHKMVSDLLANPGEQDLTADVNFAALREAGEREGLNTHLQISQGRFLTRILGNYLRGGSAPREWSGSGHRQLQSLTHPDNLGERFRVLVQTRAV